MYWCSPLPVRRLQPVESYNSLSFSSFSWKGATTPSLALALAKILVRRCWPIIFSPPGTMFHQFSDWIHWRTPLQYEGHVSSNFHTGPINIIEAHKHLATSIPNTETLSIKQSPEHRAEPWTLQHYSEPTVSSKSSIKVHTLLGQTEPAYIRAFTNANPRIDL